MASPIQVVKSGSFTGHRDCVYALEPSGLPEVFFSAAGDGMVVQWNLEVPDQGQLIARIPASVYALHYFAPAEQLWIGQNFDGLHVIDLATRQEVKSVKITSAAIFDIKAWQDTVFAATGDGLIQAIDVHSMAVRKHLKASDRSVRCLAIHPHRNELAAGYSDHCIRIFDLNTYALKYVLTSHTNSVFTIAYSPDGQHLLSGGRDAHLKGWNVAEGYSLQHSVVAHLYAINHLAFSPDGRYFATGSMDKSIKVWDAATFRLLKVIDRARHAGHGTSVNKLLWSNHHNQLVSCSDDRTISVWELDFNRLNTIN